MLGGSTPAVASTSSQVTVDMVAEYFIPSGVSVARGGTVTWDTAHADATHTVTDDTGMALFDSGLIHPGDPDFSYTYIVAGSYPYVCVLHASMIGTVGVPVRAAPSSGRIGRTFTVTWASGAVPDGSVSDVQMKRRGHPWSTWQDGVTAASGSFTPTRDGVELFRARLRRLDDATTSGWSAAVKIVVG